MRRCTPWKILIGILYQTSCNCILFCAGRIRNLISNILQIQKCSGALLPKERKLMFHYASVFYNNNAAMDYKCSLISKLGNLHKKKQYGYDDVINDLIEYPSWTLLVSVHIYFYTGRWIYQHKRQIYSSKTIIIDRKRLLWICYRMPPL